MRRRFDKLVASFLAVVLCVAFVPLIAIAQNPSEDLTDAGLVTTTESSTDSDVATPAETAENATGKESSEITEPPAVETPTDGTTVEEETTEGDASEETTTEEELTEETPEPISEDTVVMIGDEEFSDLQEALDAMAKQRALSFVPLDFVKDVTANAIIRTDTTFNLNGFTWTGNGASALTCTTPNATITLNGAGTIQAAKGYRAITLTGESSKIIVNNVLLKGNNEMPSLEKDAKSQGGLLYATKSKVEANQSAFENGLTSTTDFSASGGALSISKGDLVLNGCEFENNKSYNGGAVSVSESGSTIIDCVFKTNTATKGFGGALKLYRLSTDPIIKGCTFEGNIAGTEKSSDANGGAIGISSSSAVAASIISCKFLRNYAPYSFGGAINAYDSSSSANKLKEISIVDSVFSENSALKGGAICMRADKLSLDSTTVTNNEALYDSASQRAITDSKYNTNYSTSGGIHFFPGINDAQFIVSNSTHIFGNSVKNENSSAKVGNVSASSEIYIVDTDSIKTNVSGFDVEENSISHDDKGNRYQIVKYSYAVKANSKAKNTQRFYSTVTEPTHVYLDPQNKCNHIESDSAKVFSNLEDAINEAIKGDKTITVCSTIELTAQNARLLENGNGITLQRCSSNDACNLLELNNGEATLGNVTLDGKGVDTAASLIRTKPGTTLNIADNANFINARKMSGNGAAIYCGSYFSATAVLNINAGNFENNYCENDGGAIYCESSNMQLGDLGSVGQTPLFKNNFANGNGGALYIHSKTELVVNGGLFEGNTSGIRGGALMIANDATNSANYTSTATINRAEFLSNSARVNDQHEPYCGGAIYNAVGCKLYMKNVLMTKNAVTGSAGYMGIEAALANCKTGSMAVYKQEGALVYDNYMTWGIAGNNKQGDISFTSTNQNAAIPNEDASRTAYVSDIALGGGKCNWTSVSGEPVPSSYYQGTNEGFRLISNPTATTVDWAERNATVIFKNNMSERAGSAIGNNGTLVIGTEAQTLVVDKKWVDDKGNDLTKDEDGKSLPKEIIEQRLPKVKVKLAYYEADGSIQTIEPGSENDQFKTRDDVEKILEYDNDWTASWGDLGQNIKWTVVEEAIPGYESSIELRDPNPADRVKTNRAILTNTWNNELTNISAEKFWKDNNNQYQIRPSSIELKLAIDANSNGVVDDKELEATSTKTAKITPNNEGIWRWEFKDLQKYTKKGEEIKYLVKETPVAGYVSDVASVFVAQTDDNGNVVKDENGNTVYTDVTTWLDNDGKEWSGFNITNSLDFADITFTKTYEGNIYKDANGNGNSTAVFRITGNFNGNDFYNNIVSANFSEAGKQTIEVKGLLVGATYTIEELKFDGSGYTPVGDSSQTFILTKDGVAADAIQFTNQGSGDEYNTGIINRYSFSAGGSNVEQIRNSQAA